LGYVKGSLREEHEKGTDGKMEGREKEGKMSGKGRKGGLQNDVRVPYMVRLAMSTVKCRKE